MRRALISVFSVLAGGLPAAARDLPAARPEMLATVQKYVQHACAPQTAAALDAVGFEPAQIAGVSYFVNSTSADVGRSVGVDAYVKIQGQSGSVVIQHRQGCSVGGAYASGNVRLPRRL